MRLVQGHLDTQLGGAGVSLLPELLHQNVGILGHIFWESPKVQMFWKAVSSLTRTNLGQESPSSN